MKQNLPLNYAEILVRYMKAQPEDKMFELTFNDETYDLDVLGNEEDGIVRVRNNISRHTWTITKYDYTCHYKDMPEIRDLLNYVESQVIFTPTQWAQHFVSEYPIYDGRLFRVYSTEGDGEFYIKQNTPNLPSFYINANTCYVIPGIMYATHVENHQLETTLSMEKLLDDLGPSFYIDSELAKDWLTALFNAEHIALHVQPLDSRDIEPINDNLWGSFATFKLPNLVITVDSEYKCLTYTLGDYDYTITNDGTLTKDLKRDPELPPRSDGIVMYKTTLYFNSFSSLEDNNFARGLVSLLNQFMETQVKEPNNGLPKTAESNSL